jgi:hypothetical protein
LSVGEKTKTLTAFPSVLDTRHSELGIVASDQ